MSMKMTAELPARQVIDEDEKENETILKITREAMETNVIVEIDGKKYEVDADDLMEALGRISGDLPTKEIS